MKSNKFIAILILMIAFSMVSFEASAMELTTTNFIGGWFSNLFRDLWNLFTGGGHQGPGGGGNSVGAPIDGGLLAVLAAGGAAYFIKRKKK